MNPISRFLAWVLIAPIRVYRRFLSPLLPPMCRFHPSCSVYAMGALHVHGPIKGSWLAVRRISRCHPFNPGGFDPVPEIEKPAVRHGSVSSVNVEELPRSAPKDNGPHTLSKSSLPLTPSSLV